MNRAEDLDTVDDKFIEDCWKDFEDKNLTDQDLAGKFHEYGPNKRQVAEYILKLYAHRAAGDRANDSEWAWRFGVASAFLLVAVGFFVQMLAKENSGTAILVVANILAAGMVGTAPWWRRLIKR